MTKTRSNGSGSITAYGEGWRLRWTMPDGKRKSKIVGSMPKREAEKILRGILAQVEAGTWADPAPEREERQPTLAARGGRGSGISFAALAKEYLAYQEPQVALGTYRNYVSLLNGPLKPFSRLYLDQINQRTVAVWWSRESAHPVNRRNAFFMLRGMFRIAVEWGMIPAIPFEVKNAGKDVSVPRPDWTVEDFDHVLGHVAPFYRAPLEVMFAAHLRIGELIALNGSDYRDGHLTINKQRTDQGQTTDTKTGQHGTTKLLKSGRAAMEARPRVLGSAPLFPGVKAQRMPRKSLQDAWNAACKAAGVENFHIHDIRHIGLSFVAESGVAEKVTQERARHGSSTSTRRYIHTSKRQHDEAVEKVDELMERRAEEKKRGTA